MSLKRKKRGNIRYFVRYILIALVLATGVKFAPGLLRKIKFFNIKKIEISGNHYLTDEFLKQRVKSFMGVNYFDIDKQEIALRFENIIRLKNVDVNCVLPAKIKINITERKAALMVKTMQGELLPIDENNYILDSRDFFVDEDVAIYDMNLDASELSSGDTITDEDLNKIIKYSTLIKNTDSSFIDEISEFYFDKENIAIIEVTTGAKIILGTENLKESIERFRFFKENTGVSKNTVYDFRFKDFLFARAEEKWNQDK